MSLARRLAFPHVFPLELVPVGGLEIRAKNTCDRVRRGQLGLVIVFLEFVLCALRSILELLSGCMVNDLLKDCTDAVVVGDGRPDSTRTNLVRNLEALQGRGDNEDNVLATVQSREFGEVEKTRVHIPVLVDVVVNKTVEGQIVWQSPGVWREGAIARGLLEWMGIGNSAYHPLVEVPTFPNPSTQLRHLSHPNRPPYPQSLPQHLQKLSMHAAEIAADEGAVRDDDIYSEHSEQKCLLSKCGSFDGRIPGSDEFYPVRERDGVELCQSFWPAAVLRASGTRVLGPVGESEGGVESSRVESDTQLDSGLAQADSGVTESSRVRV
ncbi:hypothetical protein BDK51DRAFT_25644 [Blyttiomyces helicus]|uniref:Uncharacterized protein n=1 Tax=Blyttiomyces helicus TaxID=388810 RepID=A0A4P9WQV9_9FUNG|nr:hypothetical protein BDK51DRAFT_25644 [Blyttiomyces helicus]|eukprot:RKO94583.1 hypothetical protein BDK51DRAFT_25644 [Blyttiomyces helicus]